MSTAASQVSMEGQLALIFGGTGGIGFVTAKAFAAAGARGILIIGRNPERAARACHELGERFPNTRCEYATADAASTAGAELGVKHCVEHFGRIDVLLSTAGGDPMPQLFHKNQIY